MITDTIQKPKGVELKAGQVITLEEMQKWNTPKYICRLCEDDAVRDPFISEDGLEVGQHINNDHKLNDIIDFVCFYGHGWRKLEGG